MDERRYPFFVYPIETDMGQEWAVEFFDVPGVIGGGETEAEAIEDAFDNLQAHLQFLADDGEPLPVASNIDEEEYSGKLPFRTSKSTHRRIKMAADREGISVNQFMNEAVMEKLTKSEYSKYMVDVIDELSNVAGRNIINHIAGGFSLENHYESATTMFNYPNMMSGYVYGTN